jgi:uncharacterized LabA/DUF88 family protein
VPERAFLFVDGNNWYHACKAGGLKDLFALDYARISQKLLGPRDWRETRYFIGALKQNHMGYREQRQFNSRIQNQDSRISVHLGRMEERPSENKLATELLAFIEDAPLDPAMRTELLRMANAQRSVILLKEKAADVMLAVQMASLAINDKYDCAYLLSADGDFTPVVELVRELGKKVYAVSVEPMFSSALKRACDSFIPLKKGWFADCYRYDQ